MLSPEQIFSNAIRVVDEFPVAVLTSIDAQGVPQSRWMTTVAVEGLSKIWTISRRRARKIEQIRAHPQVGWIFSNADQTDVVTLTGRAEVIDGGLVAASVWDRLSERVRMYAMGPLGGADDDLEMVAIQSEIDQGELLSPRLGILSPVAVRLQR